MPGPPDGPPPPDDAAEAHQKREGRDADVAGYISNNYTLLPSGGGGAPGRSPKLPRSPSSRARQSLMMQSPGKGARSNLPVIAESSVMSSEGEARGRSQMTPHTSPDIPVACLPEPPHMQPSSVACTGLHGSPKGARGEVAELVVRLREERRGNLLLVERIKSLENVVREQETLLRAAESKIPKTPLEWGSAALLALDQASEAGAPLTPHEQRDEGSSGTAQALPAAVSGVPEAEAQEAEAQEAGTAGVHGSGHAGCKSRTAEAHGTDGGMQSRGLVGSESQVEGEVQAIAASERELTQAAKISALQYKVSSLTEELELLHAAFDKRERKRALELKEATDQLEAQDSLVATLKESLERQEVQFNELMRCTETVKAEHRAKMESLRAAMKDAKELFDKQLENERETSQTVVQALRVETESLREQLRQSTPGRNVHVKMCDVGIGDGEMSPVVTPVDEGARQSAQLWFDLGTRDKADQALERLRDSLEEHLSVDTPDSMLSDRDTLHGTIRNHPVELSGDSASRPSPFLQEDLEAKNSCNPAVDSKKAARQPQLAEKSLAEAAEQRRQEGGADGEGEAGATVVDVESYNRAKEELLLAQNTVGSQVAEIESLNAQLEHMKGFLANMTVLG